MKTLLLKNLEILGFALLISSALYAQNIQLKKFNSKELNSERYLKIYIPPGYKSNETKLYPLTIVLDAEYLFDVYVANSILFSAKETAPEQIIVGINQNQFNERAKDCEYSKENSLPTKDAEAFYRFIRSELMDYLEENYRLSPFRTIVGNTLTANFINYFLIEDKPGFNAFVAINPYYAQDMPALMHQKIPTLKNEKRFYYLSGGSYLPENWKNQIYGTSELLKTANNPKFNFQYEFFENCNAVASIGQSISRAFVFIFEVYSAISKEEFEKNIKDLSPADAIAYLKNKYVEIEYLFGSNLKIRESDIFAIESIILDKENGDYLKNFGEMINRLYKELPIGDYYIGRYYETRGNFKQALQYYKIGYMKLPEGDPNADGFYENIKRVLKKRDGTYRE